MIADLGVYVTVFACSLLAFQMFQPRRPGVVPALIVTSLFYVSPLLVLISAAVFLLYQQGRIDDMIAVREFRGEISFSHDFFSGNNQEPWTLKEGSSLRPISPSSMFVPASMVAAAREAINIHPFCPPMGGFAVVKTTVHMEKGQPVITDWTVSYEQLKRRYAAGHWDWPEDYKQQLAGIKILGDIDHPSENGMVHLPAKLGPESAFMSQFNGPKLTPVRRTR